MQNVARPSSAMIADILRYMRTSLNQEEIGSFFKADAKDYKTIKTQRMKNFNEVMFLTDVASINWIRALGQTDEINILVSNSSILFS